MALWIDREWVGLAELSAIDSEVASIAEAEEIDVGGSGGVAREAFAECSNWLTTSFPSLNGAFDPVAYVGGAVNNRFRLEQVVMTEEYGERRTPLRDWLIWSTLAAFYRSAVRRSLNDRYERKLELAEREVAKRLSAVRRGGVPVVFNPIPAPGAVFAPWAEAVGPLIATVTSGGGVGETVVYYAATFAAGEYESSRSEVGSISLADSETFNLSAIDAVPPFAVAGITAPTGWWPYLGLSATSLRRVGDAAIALGSILADARAAVSVTGDLMNNGQAPDCVIQYRDLILRG